MNLYEDLKKYTQWAFGWVSVFIVLVGVLSATPIGRDDTDPGSWGARSSLAPRTDSLTGCQYLETSRGGLTPRRDRDGKHVGCKEALK